MAVEDRPVPGDLVRIRDQRWRVVRCAHHGDATALDVVTAERSAGHRRATFLVPFDRCEPLPFDRRPKRVAAAQWRRIARTALAEATPRWSSLGAALRARIDLLPFQLEPALAMTTGRGCRFLIADAVGLGKTIQAGLMIAETLARLPGSRVLVVTPAGLRDQWIDELRERFTLAPRVIDADHLAEAAALLPEGTNPWRVGPLLVTSIDYLKRADVIRSVETLIWDLVVFDEAHTLAGRSDRAAAAAALSARARCLVLLTATPHSGDEDAFQRLCRIGELRGSRPLITFRRTRDVLGIRRTRRSCALRVRPTPSEGAMHAALREYAATVALRGTPGGHLAISVLERRAASSAASLCASAERRLAYLSDDEPAGPPQLQLPFADEGDDEAPAAELMRPALGDRDEEVAHLRRLASRARAAAKRESKLLALRRLLRRVSEPAIVFTQYRDTLATIAATLACSYVELHGGMSAHERRDAARRFTQGSARVLLATDAASEGLNLHQRCRLVVNLEMPWTPVRLEQRVGRVDRLGQTHNVHAIHLVAAGTTDESVAARVDARAAAAQVAAAGAGGHEHAIDECSRLQYARRLLTRGAVSVDARPVVTTLGTHSPFSWWAFRLPFADAGGNHIWEAIAAVQWRPTEEQRGAGTDALRRAITTPSMRAAVAHVRDAWTKRYRAEMTGILNALDARERAIAAALKEHRARLSMAVLQRGLFDRRRERAGLAQKRLLDEADAACLARLDLIEAMRHGSTSDVRPIFGACGR